MTLVSLMKDENPRVQIAAAKALLSRDAAETVAPEPLDRDLSNDDIDRAGPGTAAALEFCCRA